MEAKRPDLRKQKGGKEADIESGKGEQRVAQWPTTADAIKEDQIWSDESAIKRPNTRSRSQTRASPACAPDPGSGYRMTATPVPYRSHLVMRSSTGWPLPHIRPSLDSCRPNPRFRRSVPHCWSAIYGLWRRCVVPKSESFGGYSQNTIFSETIEAIV